MSRQERTGLRDLALNYRHREWGDNVPAIDVDYFIEYDCSIARGVVEYKNEHADRQHSSHPNYRALINFCQPRIEQLPLLAVRYSDDFSAWTVTALNESAGEYQPTTTTMSEEEYVRLLYQIRGRTLPRSIALSLPATPPPDDNPDDEDEGRDFWPSEATS